MILHFRNVSGTYKILYNIVWYLSKYIYFFFVIGGGDGLVVGKDKNHIERYLIYIL